VIPAGAARRAEKSWAEGEEKITAVPKNTNNLWTPEEEKLLKSLIESNKPIPSIVTKLQRSV
jgi:hypothetical protein